MRVLINWCKTAVFLLAGAASILPAYADPLRLPFAALNEYFSHVPALPIRLPNNDVPGDIYITPYEGYQARNGECFPQLVPTEAPTNLAAAQIVASQTAQGEIGAKVSEIVDLTAQAGVSLKENYALVFDDASVRSYTNLEISDALQHLPTNCADRLNAIMGSSPNQTLQGVLWILRDVISARMTAELAMESGNTANVGAELDARLNGLVSDPKVSISSELQSSGKVKIGYASVLPVAYRPAFISLDDMRRLQYYDEHAFWAWFKGVLTGTTPALDELKKVREQFPDIPDAEVGGLPRPGAIYKRMGEGKPIEYNPENPEHRAYLEHSSLLLAASWELYREP
jgi:hypothetical protein